MPCNAKNTATMQTALKTPPKAVRESQSAFSSLSADFWQDIERDGLTMIHSISPLRGCRSPHSDLHNPTPKKRWKRRRLITTDKIVPSGDGNQDEKHVSKGVIADNTPSIGKAKRKRYRRRSSLMPKGTSVLVSSQEDAVEARENIDGESFASVKPISYSKQTDQEQVFENSTLNCVDRLKAPVDRLKAPVDRLKAPVDPHDTGQKRVMTELAATKAKRPRKNSGRKKGLESAGHSPNYRSRKTKGGNTSGNTSAPVECSTPVGVLSTKHLAEPQRTNTDLLGRFFDTPKSSRSQQFSTLTVEKLKCRQNTPASGKALKEAEIVVQSTSKNHPGVEGIHPQQTPQMPSPANLSLSVTLADLLEELSTSKRSRRSTRLAKAKLACHEEKRQRRISLKRKHRESIGELDVTPGQISEPKDDLHTAKFQDIKLSASLANPSEIRSESSILDESLVEKHCQTQTRVPHVQLEREVDVNKAPVKNGSDFETPKQRTAGAGSTCTLCSFSCECPPSMKTPSPASEGIQTSGNVSRGVQIAPVVLRADNPESEPTETSTQSSLNSQSCQTDFHRTQTQTAHETTSSVRRIPPEECSTSIPPSDQREEPRKATVTEPKSLFDSLLGARTPSKHFSKPSQPPVKETEHSENLKHFFESILRVPTRSKSLPKPTPLLRRLSHRRRSKSAESSVSTRQTGSICSQSSSEEAPMLMSHCLSPVIQMVKPPPAPGETLPKELPLNFMKFSMHCSGRPVGKRQMRIPQELFSSSGESDSDVGRAREAAQRFINMTEGGDSDDRLGDRRGDYGEKVVASQQVHRKRYRGFLDDSDGGNDGVDSADGEESSSHVLGDGDRSNEHTDLEEYLDNDETSAQQVNSSDEEDNDRTVVGTSASDNGGEGNVGSSDEEWREELDDEVDYGNVFILDQATESKLNDDPEESDGYSDHTNPKEYLDNDETSAQQVNSSDEEDNDRTIVGTSASEDGGEGDVGSSDEEWREELDDEVDYGNVFILDQATESKLKDDPEESDGYSDADDSDMTDESQSENLTEGDIFTDTQQRQTTDNKVCGRRRSSPRKNRRRILVGLFSSSEESSSSDSRAAELAQGEIDSPGGSRSCDVVPDRSKISIGERRVMARQLFHRRENSRDVMNNNSSRGNDADVVTDHNSSDEDSKENVLQKQISSTSVLDDDESKLEEQVKPKKRLKPTGLLSVRGKMLKIFREQAERKMMKNTSSTTEKRTKSKEFKQRDIETSHHEIASKDHQLEPNGQAAESTGREVTGHGDRTDHDGEVLHGDARDERQDERKERAHDDDDLDNDVNVDGHVIDSREEGDVFKDDTEDIGGSDSDDTSLNIPDYGSSDDCPEIYDGLLKKSKSQRKKHSEMAGLLDVKRKSLQRDKQTSEGKQTKSRNVEKKDGGKTNHRQSTSEECRKESRNKKRGGPNFSGQTAQSEEGDATSDQNNLVQDDVLGDDGGVDGQTNNDRTEGGGIGDIGGSDSDVTIMNFTDNENRGVSGEATVMNQATKALQSEEVTKSGLQTGRKSAKSKKRLNFTESSDYHPDVSNRQVKKSRVKKSPKLTGLLTEEGIMKNGRATNGKQTKLMDTNEDGETDHQQTTSVEQHGEPRSNEKGLNGCDIKVTDRDLGDEGNEDMDDANLKLSDDGSLGATSRTSSLRQSKKMKQLKTKKQTTEGSLKERKSTRRKSVKKSHDRTERKEDGPKSHGGLLDKGKPQKKLTQKTLPEMADMGKSKKKPVPTESMEKTLHLDDFNERLDNDKPMESQKQKTPPVKTGLLVLADKGEIPKLLKQQAERKKTKDKRTKSRDSKKEDKKSNRREKIAKEHQQVARNKKVDVHRRAAESMDIDDASDGNNNNDCDTDVANCGIIKESHDKEKVQDDDLYEDNSDGGLNFSDDENREVRSRTGLSRQSKKKTLTKKNAQEGGPKERNSPKSRTIKSSCDLTKRKEDDSDKSTPLEKLRRKTLPKKTDTKAESKKAKTKLVIDWLKKTKQMNIRCSPVEKTSEDIYGESTVDNTAEDVDSTCPEGDVGIMSKTHTLKKSAKGKTARPERAVRRELIKERNSPRKGDLGKSVKTIEPTEVVAELMNERKSTEKKKQLSAGGKSVDKERGGTCSKNSSSTQPTKFTKLKSKEHTEEGQLREKKTPKTTKSKKNLVWAKLVTSTRSSGKSNSITFEESDGDSDDGDYYKDAVDMVFSGKTQDEREGDSFEDGSNDEESLEDFGQDGEIVSECGTKTTLQNGGDGVRSSTDKKGGGVQENWGEASKDDDEGVDGFDGVDSSLPLTGDGCSGLSRNNRNKEAVKGSRNSSTTVKEVLKEEHSVSSEEFSDDQIIPSSFLHKGERSASQKNACPFDHMGNSYRGKKHGCTCLIGNSPRRGKTKRKATKNSALTGSEDLDPDITKGRPMRTRLTKPPSFYGLLKDKGKMLTLFKQEAARNTTENIPATDVKLEACNTSCNFGEMNPLMYTIKSDTNRAICESLITPMPQEWEEPTISSKDREDHRSALRSIFYDSLLKRGRENRIATRRLGRVKIIRGPTIKEARKANTAEKRRLKKLEAEVNSDGWIEYDMLPAVYPEIDAAVFIKEIK